MFLKKLQTQNKPCSHLELLMKNNFGGTDYHKYLPPQNETVSPSETLTHSMLTGYFSIAVLGQKMSEPRFNTAVWSNETHPFLIAMRFYLRGKGWLLCDGRMGNRTRQFLKSIRETFVRVKSNLKPAALHWYLHCTALGAAGCIRYNPLTKSNHLLHNGAARTCQQTVAQFYLSTACGSLAAITLQKLCWSWGAV